MKDKKAEVLEQFMTVVYENGYSSDMVKEECEEIIKTCTVEGNSSQYIYSNGRIYYDTRYADK